MADDPRRLLVRLRARPDTLYLSRGRTVMALGRDGTISPRTNQGVYVHETRLVSRLEYRIAGAAPQPVALSNVESHSWLGYYIALRPGADESPDHGSGQVPNAAQDALELRVARTVGEGLREELTLTNFGRDTAAFELRIDIEADFADVQEAGGRRRQTGRVRARWVDERTLTFDYEADRGERHVRRGVELHLSQAPPRRTTRGALRFALSLAPHERWRLTLDFVATRDGRPLAPDDYDAREADALQRTTTFTSSRAGTREALVLDALEQARRDLAALRLYDLDAPDGGWVAAAGLPLFVALFGRDTLTTSWEAALLTPDMMTGSLEALARTQGTRDDPWRDEEPGRMLHESHTGPLSTLEVLPYGRSYSSITTSSFYPFVLSSLWHWTGDRDLVQRYVEPALAALRWRDRHERTPRGFYAYRTRSAQGVKNQGWKDSGDAIVDEIGRDVAPPLATCEEQGFVYTAKLFLSELLWWLDRKDESKRLRHEAAELKKAFVEHFWMDDESFVAMAVDGADRPVRSIGSNPGHCLASGILDDAQVVPVAERLMAPDLFSGWGVRTLSTGNPAFNPYSYHRGSMWPVEQGPFALGFMRYGLHEQLERLCRAVFDCAALFDFHRLPEVVSGHARDGEHPFPALYPGANAPQAWSSSALFCLLQAMLGLYPYAPLHALALDPHLPEWLPEVQLRGLRVGRARVDLDFEREASGRTRFTVREREGSLHIVHQPSPWSLTAGLGERIRDLMTSVV
jgi:glycogen debranching enzyme